MRARDDIDAGRSMSGRGARPRSVRLAAATLAVGLTAAVIVSAGGGTAEAAAGIRAQSVGRLVDGTVGGMAIQSLADLKDARAQAAPDTSSRNPLSATLLGQLDVPLGDSLKLPGAGALTLGAANQLAVANTDGYSYGASGAVSNTGGVDLTDDQGAYPSDAKIDLSSDLLGSTTIPGLPAIPGLPTIPGLPATGDITAAALGGVTADIGAVQALAQTKTGGEIVTPQSKVASITLTISSPALKALLAQLSTLTGSGVLSTLTGGLSLPIGTTLPADCALSLSPSTDPISLAGGGVVLDPADATITVDVGKLVKKLLGKDISNLDTSNFDLTTFLAKNLPSILSTGLSGIVTSITDPLMTQFTACTAALNDIPVLGLVTSTLIMTLVAQLQSAQMQLTTAISSLGAQFSTAAGGPLAQLASGLEMAVDVGLNIQDGPKVQQPDPDYPFESDLAATPDQATSVVNGQSLVRAIEIDLLDAASLPSSAGLPDLPSGLGALPTTNSLHQRQLAGAHAGARYAVAPGDGAAVIALGNAAAGPSTAAVSTPTPTPSTIVPASAIPTGVPAGDAAHGGGNSPLLPIALLLLGLTIVGGGVASYRLRGRHGR